MKLDEMWTSGVVATSSVEEQAETARQLWNVEHVQLAGGGFRGRTLFVSTPRLVIYRESWNRPLHIRGELGPDRVAFALPASTPQPYRLWGNDIVEPWVAPHMTSADELDIVTPATYTNTVLVLSAGLLDEVAIRCGFQRSRFAGGGFLPVHPAASHRLSRMVDQALSHDRHQGPRNRPLAGVFEEDLADALLVSVDTEGTGQPASPPGGARRRRHIVGTCLEFARERAFDVSIPELCTATSAARRTLEYAFREHLGISPARYLRLCRYRRALSALAGARTGESSVADIAIRVGFSEFGRFAVEYRKLFGEVPSTTLRRPPTDVPRIPGLLAGAP